MEWISVKDRLPEDGDIVLAHHMLPEYLPSVAVFIRDHVKQFILSYRPDWGLEEVTHWMPLPDFPLSESNTQNKG